MVPGKKRMINTGSVVMNSYTGDFLLHLLDCLWHGTCEFERAEAEIVCMEIENRFGEVFSQDADSAINLLIAHPAIADWARAENQAYASVWEEKIAKAEEFRQDFDEFLNWRFHQIEFYFEKMNIKPHVIWLAEYTAELAPAPLENIQFIPFVTGKDMYVNAYLVLLEQLVRPLAVSVMVHNRYAMVEAVARPLSRLAVCILVDACHATLRQEMFGVYGIRNWNVNQAPVLFDLPGQLCSSLEERLLSME